MSEYKRLSCLRWDLRRDRVDIMVAGEGGHIGGDMRVIDVLVALYSNHLNISPETMDDPNRDRFVSPRKAIPLRHIMQYSATRASSSMTSRPEKFSKFGSPYIGHPNNKLPGIEMNSGSLGHGLPVGVGMALAGKMDRHDYRVYTSYGRRRACRRLGLGGRHVGRQLQAG